MGAFIEDGSEPARMPGSTRGDQRQLLREQWGKA
jgi:hypothetical protein